MVANGAGGGVQAFSAGGHSAQAGQPALDDADNLRLGPSDGQVYAGYGRALAVLDPNTLRVLRNVSLDGHPESFQLESTGGRLFVNVPSAGHIAVVDLHESKVSATWMLTDASANFPMNLDEDGHRVLVATRSPAELRAYDMSSGSLTFRSKTCGDADDLFFDAVRKQLYVVCGEGKVEVFRREGAGYALVQQVPTARGARTGLFVPELSKLFVAAPARSSTSAQILAYKVR